MSTRTTPTLIMAQPLLVKAQRAPWGPQEGKQETTVALTFYLKKKRKKKKKKPPPQGGRPQLGLCLSFSLSRDLGTGLSCLLAHLLFQGQQPLLSILSPTSCSPVLRCTSALQGKEEPVEAPES